MEQKNYIKQIRTAANVGLIGSLSVVVVAVLFKYLSNYAFYQTQEVFKVLTLIASVFVVLDVVLLLRIVRKQIPKLKEIGAVEERLRRYASMIKTMNYCTLVISMLECSIIVLIGNYNLLMLAMLLVLTLFFTYPNMYKIKVDLGLDAMVMKSLFGDQYQMADTEDTEVEMVDPLAKENDEK